MLRVIVLLLGSGLLLPLGGCGDSCESVQKKIESIGRDIQKNPESAMDHSKELSELRDKLKEMGCLG